MLIVKNGRFLLRLGVITSLKAVIVASILGLMTLVIHRFSITTPGHLSFFLKTALFMLEQGTDTTDDVKDNLSQISRQVDRAARIINQMRELARITERQFVLVNINDIVRDSVEFLKPHLKNSGIETTFSPTDNLPLINGHYLI